MWSNNNYTIKWYEKDGNILILSTETILSKIGNVTEKLDPRKSAINTITFDFDVDNPSDEFSKFLYKKLSTKGKMFFREIVEVYKNDFILYKGFVRSIKLKDSLESKYSIQLENVIGKLKTSLWDREFSEYINETIENINNTRLATGFVMQERIKDNTKPVEQQEKYRIITYNGHIFDCLKGIMQMTLSKPEIKVNVLFLDNNYHNFLDVAKFNDIKSEFDSSIYTVNFEWTDPIENIFEFFQEQIFQAVGVVPIVTQNGKLVMKVHQQPTVTQGIKRFDEFNTIKYNSKGIDESQVVNYLKIDYVKIDDEYLKSLIKINSGSFEFFGNELIPEKPQQIKVDSINNHSRADQITFCSNIADRLFSRYSREINVLDIKVPIQEGYNIELGEFIDISSDMLIDWDSGQRGFSEKVQEEVSPIARFGIGDIWGGFIEGNTLGIGADGQIVVTTTIGDIQTNYFRDINGSDNIKSFLENHADVKRWVDSQIG